MVYGPGQMDFTKLVPHVLSQLLQGREAHLSSGATQFDWVHVDDVAEALVVIAAAPDVIGRTIDVGTGVLAATRDVALHLAQRVGAPQALKLGVIPDRAGEPIRLANTAETERLTGWKARIALQAGLDDTADWFKHHFTQSRDTTAA
jgi:nucleoside-diphosphate-sugar epimerase